MPDLLTGDSFKNLINNRNSDSWRRRSQVHAKERTNISCVAENPEREFFQGFCCLLFKGSVFYAAIPRMALLCRRQIKLP